MGCCMQAAVVPLMFPNADSPLAYWTFCQIQATICGPLLAPLTTMLGDSVERCRAGALQLLTGACSAMPALEPLLPVLLGALVDRMGSLPPAEPAEELRLQITELVATIMERATPR
jgi:hypothetical protein